MSPRCWRVRPVMSTVSFPASGIRAWLNCGRVKSRKVGVVPGADRTEAVGGSMSRGYWEAVEREVDRIITELSWRRQVPLGALDTGFKNDVVRRLEQKLRGDLDPPYLTLND